ncbi:MAG: DUF4405 domain-containing protein [Deltaproteobacteria bacterium]|nr:DUF4405 domain-containing protein [Deltaproteobacteria bacterium]
MEKTMKKFNIRAFVALMIAFSALGLPITGIANHVYGFSDLTVTRHAWMSAHNILGLLFIIFSIWHIVLNRRALLNYIRGAAARIPFLSREAALAGAVVTLALFIFVGHAFHAGG